MTDHLSALLVDDEPGFADALRIALEARGFECRSETDMTGAIRYLEQNDVSVLVTDIMMPAGPGYPKIESAETGFHLVAEVRSRWPYIPIVCLSVIGDQKKIDQLKAKKVRYLRKGETPLERAVATIYSAATGKSSF
jgi:DNA-binding NarL/FixJ family response regulator